MAAVHDRAHHLRSPGESGLIGIFHPAANALELELADAPHHVVGQRVVGDHIEPAQERWLEDLEQVIVEGVGQGSGLGPRLGIGAELHHRVGAGVAGHDDDGVFEVDVAALAVLHGALVEHLIEDVLHAGVGLLHLVEQHHAVGPAADRLGEHAPLAVADIPRRRTHQERHFVLLLELAHVDDGHVRLIAEEQFGERQRRLRLAHAAGAGQQEHTRGTVGIGEPGPRRADPLGDHRQRV